MQRPTDEVNDAREAEDDARPFTGARLVAEQRERLCEELDEELEAIRECVLAIDPLSEGERRRVLAWLAGRYGA